MKKQTINIRNELVGSVIIMLGSVIMEMIRGVMIGMLLGFAIWATIILFHAIVGYRYITDYSTLLVSLQIGAIFGLLIGIVLVWDKWKIRWKS